MTLIPLLFALLIQVTPDGSGGTYAGLLSARDAVRAVRQQGSLSAGEPIEIRLAPGDYVLDSTLALTTADSGSRGNPIRWCAAERGTVRILGARPFDTARFRLSDEPAPASGIRYEADVADLVDADFSAWTKAFRSPPAPWFYVNGVACDWARWPNRLASDLMEWTTAKSFSSTGGVNIAGITFAPAEDRARNWDLSQDIWLHGYWRYVWAEEYLKLGSRNAQGDLTTAATPIYTPVLGTPWTAANYYALNVREELDVPGEWWLDRATRRMECILPVDGLLAECVIVNARGPLLTFGTSAHDIAFENITFAYAEQPFSAADGVSRLAWSGCDFFAFAKAGVINGAENAITDCSFRQLACGALDIQGGNRPSLTRALNCVDRCVFEDFSRNQLANMYAVWLRGCGQVVRDCTFSRASHTAILYSGNEHLIMRCSFANVLRETSDAGIIYCGRDVTLGGTAIVGCSFRDCDRNDVNGIYFDDVSWGGDVYDCTFENIYRVLEVGGGNLHRLRGNFIRTATYGLHIDRRGYTDSRFNQPVNGTNWCNYSYQQAQKLGIDASQGVWAAAYPKILPTLALNPQEPYANIIEDCFFTGCTYWSTLALNKSTYNVQGGPTLTRIEVVTNGVDAAREDAFRARLAPFHARFLALTNAPSYTFASADGSLRVTAENDASGRFSYTAAKDGIDCFGLVPFWGETSDLDAVRFARPICTASAAGSASFDLVNAVDGQVHASVDFVLTATAVSTRLNLDGTAGEWVTTQVPMAALADGILTIDVPAGTMRSLTTFERQKLLSNAATTAIKTGEGTLILDEPLSGYAGAWGVSNGYVRVSAAYDAFGSPGEALVEIRETTPNYTRTVNILVDTVITRPVHIIGNNRATLEMAAGVQVTFRYPVSFSGSGSSRLKFGQSSVMCFEAGVTSTGLTFCVDGAGRIVVDNQPASLSYLWVDGSMSIELNCPSNNLGAITFANTKPGRLTWSVPDALLAANNALNVRGEATLILPNVVTNLNRTLLLSGANPKVRPADDSRPFVFAGVTLSLDCAAAVLADVPVVGESVVIDAASQLRVTNAAALTNQVTALPRDIPLVAAETLGGLQFRSSVAVSKPARIWKDAAGSTAYLHIGDVKADQVLEQGQLRGAASPTDWPGTYLFDASASGCPPNALSVYTWMARMNLSGTFIASEPNRVLFTSGSNSNGGTGGDFIRADRGVYYWYYTPHWYAYDLTGDFTNFRGTAAAEWGASLYLKTPVFAGGFDLGNLGYLEIPTNCPHVSIAGTIRSRDGWLALAWDELVEVDTLDFAFAEPSTYVIHGTNVYTGKLASEETYVLTNGVKTTAAEWCLNAITAKSNTRLVARKASLAGTYLRLLGYSADFTVGDLVLDGAILACQGCIHVTNSIAVKSPCRLEIQLASWMNGRIPILTCPASGGDLKATDFIVPDSIVGTPEVLTANGTNTLYVNVMNETAYSAASGYVRLTNSCPTGITHQMKDYPQFSYFCAGGWSDGQWPHAGTNYFVGANYRLTLPPSAAYAATNYVARGLASTAYWTKVRFFGDSLTVAGSLYAPGVGGNSHGYAFAVPDLRLLPRAVITAGSSTAASYFDFQTNTCSMTVKGTSRDPAWLVGGGKGHAYHIAMRVKGESSAVLALSATGADVTRTNLAGDMSEYAGEVRVMAPVELQFHTSSTTNLSLNLAGGTLLLKKGLQPVFADFHAQAGAIDASPITFPDKTYRVPILSSCTPAAIGSLRLVYPDSDAWLESVTRPSGTVLYLCRPHPGSLLLVR